MAGVSSEPAVELDELILLIPGYDPVATAAPGDWFDYEEAVRALEFFPRYLVHIQGQLAGKPFELAPWQASIIANVFGWKRADGTRRYREVLVYVPRKNGKSFLVSGICNYVFFCDGEPGAEVLCAAGTKDQARKIFGVAKSQVLRNAELSAAADVWKQSIELPNLDSVFRPVSGEAKDSHGTNPSCVAVDELHVQYSDALVEALESGQGARTQPLTMYVTTADIDRPTSICNEIHARFSKIRDGAIKDPSSLPVIYEASQKDDWTSEDAWRKANPNLGISVSFEELRDKCQKALGSPFYQGTFKRLRLNMKVGATDAFLNMRNWEDCPTDIDLSALHRAPCFAGLDLAQVNDFAALVLYFPTKGHVVLPFFWLPEGVFGDHAKAGTRKLYERFRELGLVEVCPCQAIDFGRIVDRLVELRKRHFIKEVAYDPNQANELALNLERKGFKMIRFDQVARNYNEPMKRLRTLVDNKELRHGRNEVLDWMASNLHGKEGQREMVQPIKPSALQKIDGMVALVFAIARSIVTSPVGPKVSAL